MRKRKLWETELKLYFGSYRIIKVINHHFTAVLSSERHQSERTNVTITINANKIPFASKNRMENEKLREFLDSLSRFPLVAVFLFIVNFPFSYVVCAFNAQLFI